MTQREWERALYRALRPLPREERKKILEYYRELFGDKREDGKSEYEILLEFGSPEQCATRIMQEDYGAFLDRDTVRRQKSRKGAYLAVIITLSVLLIGPLTLAVASVVISLFACAVAGGGISVGGLFVIVWGAFQAALGESYMLALIGSGMMMVGAGLLMLVSFWLLGKYCAIGWTRLLKWIYQRREKDERHI